MIDEASFYNKLRTITIEVKEWQILEKKVELFVAGISDCRTALFTAYVLVSTIHLHYIMT
jgi:hypothetical protein